MHLLDVIELPSDQVAESHQDNCDLVAELHIKGSQVLGGPETHNYAEGQVVLMDGHRLRLGLLDLLADLFVELLLLGEVDVPVVAVDLHGS